MKNPRPKPETDQHLFIGNPSVQVIKMCENILQVSIL